MSIQVVIAGGGFAGLAACKPLATLARKRSDLRVTLLDPRPYTTMVPALPDLAGGRYDQRYLTGPISELAGAPVIYRNARISTLDLDRKEVRAGQDRYAYDYLVLAVGSVTNLFGFDQHLEAVHTLDYLEDATRIQAQFQSYLQEQGQRTAIVVGGGYTGMELACNLRYAGRTLTPPPRVVVAELKDNVLSAMPGWVRAYMVGQAERLGLELVTGVSVSSFDGKNAELSNGQRFEDIFLCWATGTAFAIADVRGKSEQIKDGRFKVAPDLSIPGHPEVFAAGDTAAIEHKGQILRKAVNFSITSGRQAGRNVAASIAGKARRRCRPVDLGWIIPFCDTGAGMLFGKYRIRGKLPLAFHYTMCSLRNYNQHNRLFFLKQAVSSLFN